MTTQALVFSRKQTANLSASGSTDTLTATVSESPTSSGVYYIDKIVYHCVCRATDSSPNSFDSQDYVEAEIGYKISSTDTENSFSGQSVDVDKDSGGEINTTTEVSGGQDAFVVGEFIVDEYVFENETLDCTGRAELREDDGSNTLTADAATTFYVTARQIV